ATGNAAPKYASVPAGGVSISGRSERPVGRSVIGEPDDDMTAVALTLGLRDQTGTGGLIMDDLAFEAVHRLEGEFLSSALDLRDRTLRRLDQVFAAVGAETVDVEHQAGPLPGLGLHGQAAELLQGSESASLLADQRAQVRVLVLTHDGQLCPTVGDVDVDIAVDI